MSKKMMEQPDPSVLHTRKRARVDASGFRTAVACNACRERKTRCSGHQPICNYCQKAGVQCVYLPGSVRLGPGEDASSSTLDEWGDKILRAIGQLQNRLSVSNNNNYPDSSIQERQGQREDTILFPIESGGPLTSIQSILHWPIFQDKLPDLSLPSLNKPRNHGSAGKASGNTSASELKELAQYFQSHYLRMLPILSSTQLKQEITKIDEDGIEWTVESCLVLLVAALGTLCKHHGQQETVPTETYTNPDPSNWRLPSHYPELIPTSAEHSLSTTSALKYWNMAKKRLAWAMEEDNLKSAQCLCLAGVWYLRNSEPIHAWKMFNSAAQSITNTKPASCHVMVPESTDGPLINFEQQVIEICLTYMCTIQTTLTPSAAKIAISFDLDPDSNFLCHPFNTSMELLQIRQMTLKCFHLLHLASSVSEISQLEARLSAVQQSLDNWYAGLPAVIQFSTQIGAGMHSDREQLVISEDCDQSLLQYRYFEVQELLLRPWLYIYIGLHTGGNQSTTIHDDYNIPVTVQEYFASQSQDRAMHHQSLIFTRLWLEIKLLHTRITDGPWLKANNLVTLSLMLMAYQMHLHPLGLSPSPSAPGIDHNIGRFEGANTNWSRGVHEVESLLRYTETPENIAYADLLKSLRERSMPQ